MEKHCVKATHCGVTSVMFPEWSFIKSSKYFFFFFRYGPHLNVTYVRQHLYLLLGEVRFTSML